MGYRGTGWAIPKQSTELETLIKRRFAALVLWFDA
jgi:hypothetical protein